MPLGKVIKSNAHTDYIAQIQAPSEVESPPAYENCASGSFVRVELDDGRWLVGLIYDTMLLCRVRTRHTRHGAETRDAPADWVRYFEPKELERRERETALPAELRRQSKSRMFK